MPFGERVWELLAFACDEHYFEPVFGQVGGYGCVDWKVSYAGCDVSIG